jgi:hypothetical protein
MPATTALLRYFINKNTNETAREELHGERDLQDEIVGSSTGKQRNAMHGLTGRRFAEAELAFLPIDQNSHGTRLAERFRFISSYPEFHLTIKLESGQMKASRAGRGRNTPEGLRFWREIANIDNRRHSRKRQCLIEFCSL